MAVSPSPSLQQTATQHESLLSLPEYATTPSPESGEWGRLLSFCADHESVVLSSEKTTFGRSSTNDVVFAAVGEISALHASIIRTHLPGGRSAAVVTDHSSNGTFLNGVRIGRGESRVLATGDELTLLLPQRHKPGIAYVFRLGSLAAAPEQPHDLVLSFADAYSMGPLLGSGGFADVFHVTRASDGAPFAAKLVDKKRFVLQQPRAGAIMDEVTILKSVAHPGIIGIEDVFDAPDTLIMVLELVTGGELLDRLLEHKAFGEPEARDYFAQICAAVAYLHDHGIVHRDIKPENILCAAPDSRVVKLSDFGLSRIVSDASFMGTLCGTPEYLAPEVLAGRGSAGYSKAVDMWSLGVVLYILLCGHMPFSESEHHTIADLVLAANYSFPSRLWASISPDAIALIKSLMHLDPAARLTAHQALEHPWVTGAPAAPPPPSPPPLTAFVSSATKPMPPAALPPAVVALMADAPPSPSTRRPKTRYKLMVQFALASLAEVEGSTEAAIVAALLAEFDVGPANDPDAVATAVRRALRALVRDGVVRTAARGTRYLFR